MSERKTFTESKWCGKCRAEIELKYPGDFYTRAQLEAAMEGNVAAHVCPISNVLTLGDEPGDADRTLAQMRLLGVTAQSSVDRTTLNEVLSGFVTTADKLERLESRLAALEHATPRRAVQAMLKVFQWSGLRVIETAVPPNGQQFAPPAAPEKDPLLGRGDAHNYVPLSAWLERGWRIVTPGIPNTAGEAHVVIEHDLEGA